MPSPTSSSGGIRWSWASWQSIWKITITCVCNYRPTAPPTTHPPTHTHSLHSTQLGNIPYNASRWVIYNPLPHLHNGCITPTHINHNCASFSPSLSLSLSPHSPHALPSPTRRECLIFDESILNCCWLNLSPLETVSTVLRSPSHRWMAIDGGAYCWYGWKCWRVYLMRGWLRSMTEGGIGRWANTWIENKMNTSSCMIT